MPLTRTEPVQDLAPRLQAGLATLDLPAEGEQISQLLSYMALLQRWNSVHNLSAAQTPRELLEQHVLDCLTVVRPIDRQTEGRPLHIIDAGAGAGLPAVVLAVMRPDWQVTAVDSVGKKVAFVRQVAGELGLPNLLAMHSRLETLRQAEGQADVVTSRAFSSLRHWVEATRHLIRPLGVWAGMKGAVPTAEIAELPADCQLFHVEPLAVPGLQAQRCLVWIRPAPRSPTS